MNKIVFFGSGWYTIPVMKRLVSHGLDLVITTEKNPDSLFLKFCKENNIKTISVSNSRDLINQEQVISSHQIAVLASFGAIIPASIIENLPLGILNIHPSLLPKYKGPSPIQYAILNGESITGVTIIKLDDKVDHGPIVAKQPYNLNGNETSEELLSILFEIGSELVEQLILKLNKNETITETPQDHNNETWSSKLSKEDGYIDLKSPEFNVTNLKFKIDNMIRGYYPWPGVWMEWESEDGEFKVVKLLPEKRIQVAGKRPMSYKDFLNGYGDKGRLLLSKLGLNS